MDHQEQGISERLAGPGGDFHHLYAAHAGRILAYLLRSGFARADAEDLCQEVFLRAHKSWRTYDPARGPLGQWLAAIARNVARRRWGRNRQGENFDPELAEETLAAPDDPADDPEAREESAAVADCVGVLPAELARLVRLRYVEGRTTRGISAVTGLPEATVRLRLKEATESLRNCLKGKGFLQ